VPQFRDVLLRHPKTNVIWAHAGVGRIVHPSRTLGMMERGLASPQLKNFSSTSPGANGQVRGGEPETPRRWQTSSTGTPDRFLFGTDEVGPTEQGST